MSPDRAEEERGEPALDLFLLFSMLLLILAHPLLDGVVWERAALGLLTFVPLIASRTISSLCCNDHLNAPSEPIVGPQGGL